MNDIKFLFMLSKIMKPFNLKVIGSSMKPTLQDGEMITICRKEKYLIGDILAFVYKNELIVHRLLRIDNNRYFCKGDNSFRLEDIEKKQVIGAVILINDEKCCNEFINDSLEINRVFRKSGYSVELTKTRPEYQKYKMRYLDGVTQ